MLTDVFAFEFGNAVGASAEDAGGFVFSEHNRVIVNVYFKGVFFLDVEGTAKFDRENDSSEFVNFSYNTGGFHKILLCNVMIIQTYNLIKYYKGNFILCQ